MHDPSINTAGRQPRLELPNWLPIPVADEAEILYQGILQKDREYERQLAKARHSGALEELGLLRRLASDQRMKSVWRELYRKKRQPPNEFLNPAMLAGIMFEARFPILHDPKNQDLAARDLFNSAFRFAARRSTLPTQHEIDSKLKPFTTMATRLRQDAQSLLSLGANVFASDLEAMALVCEKHADDFNPGPLNPIVKRSRGDQVVRAYILRMSITCREIFHKMLPGTVATIAGVVFSKKVTGPQVRDIVRAYDSAR